MHRHPMASGVQLVAGGTVPPKRRHEAVGAPPLYLDEAPGVDAGALAEALQRADTLARAAGCTPVLVSTPLLGPGAIDEAGRGVPSD